MLAFRDSVISSDETLLRNITNLFKLLILRLLFPLSKNAFANESLNFRNSVPIIWTVYFESGASPFSLVSRKLKVGISVNKKI